MSKKHVELGLIIADLELTAVGDENLLGGLARVGAQSLHLLHHILTTDNLTKDHVLTIQPLSASSSNEELATVSVGTGIGHGQQEGLRVLQLKILIGKLGTVNATTTSPIVIGEITSLAHELRDDAVEGATLVGSSLMTHTQGTEVLGSLGDHIGKQLKGNATQVGTIGGNVKENLGVGHGG